MDVKKGSWKNLGNGKHAIVLDQEFKNFHDDASKTGTYFPGCNQVEDFDCI
ncbi:hypothetical protein PMZ80_000056 [Knufia obscura]|uniref:Uncharacterized protein n=2 Tax=Knufia TaxID=430999 RepID=A0AAN8ENL2_9EURO|nr:hypothetical protein PMZ80_000056 [Knufia obscura]KAK5948763.1 hypothetical protein OHC33_010186 [Knufia fluminis]